MKDIDNYNHHISKINQRNRKTKRFCFVFTATETELSSKFSDFSGKHFLVHVFLVKTVFTTRKSPIPILCIFESFNLRQRQDHDVNYVSGINFSAFTSKGEI